MLAFVVLAANKAQIEDAIESGEIKIDGKEEAFTDFLSLLDNYPYWFNIVTP